MNAWHCEKPSMLGSGKHRPDVHVFNAALKQKDYCTNCLREIILVEHSAFPAQEWVRTTSFQEWP